MRSKTWFLTNTQPLHLNIKKKMNLMMMVIHN